MRHNLFQHHLKLLALLAAAFVLPAVLSAQEAPLLWNSVQNYRYNIHRAVFDSGTRVVTVVFSVTNPADGNSAYNIRSGVAPFKFPATLRVDVSWNAGSWGSTQLINTGSDPGTGELLAVPRTWMVPVPGSGGVGPANPNVVNALTSAKPCNVSGAPCGEFTGQALKFWVQNTLPAQAVGMGRVAVEGHPSEKTGTDATGLPVYGSVPVKSVFMDISITGGIERKPIVDFNKCKGCHDGRQHGDTVVPRLSLHGANRNEEPGLCVVCHNPNQTDAAYRTTGAEESIDFKRMIHGIHAGEFRKSPLVIIGFRGSVHDYSHVKFPSELRNCVKCHIDSNGKGTFELPLSTTLGSAVNTNSQLSVPGYVDVNPGDDLRISPIASTCSGCHGSSEVKRHMISKGASFGVLQGALKNGEQCATCHGPGKDRDVRKAHEIGGSH